MKLKRLITFGLAFATIFGMAGCDNSSTDDDPGTTVDPVDPDDPVDPVDPEDPVDPVDPEDPVDPVDPEDPVDPVDPDDPITTSTYTYRTSTSLSPSTWNVLNNSDSNSNQILSYLQSSFFEYDFKFDENGNVIDGEYEVKYSAATKLEDITEDFTNNSKYSVPSNATSGYAYRITLRDDLKWDDGTEITANDFVYSMQQQLDPLYKNYGASTYYNASVVIHNAKDYLYQGSSEYFAATDVYSEYSADDDSNLVFTLSSEGQQGGVKSYLASSNYTVSYFTYYVDYYVAYCPTYFTDSSACYFTEENAAKMEGMTIADIKADETLSKAWDQLITVWGWWYTNPQLQFTISHYTWPTVDFGDVGIYAESDTELVIVLDKAISLLNDDDSLSYRAVYYLGSLPLVKEDLYEANRVSPADGATLYTSTYCSSVDTTASWGPYKLTEFQSGKFYALEKNENWYGYSLEDNEGLYQTDRIECETISEYQTRLLKFLAGELDTIDVDTSEASKYKNSSQALLTPSDYTGEIQLQSSYEALKNRESEGVNKTILAYTDFRKALSLSIDRADYVATCTTGSLAGYGLFTEIHYYDIENGGVYRYTEAAKKAICSVYGIDVDEYDSLDDAYEAITGYDLTLAKELFNSAYEAALAAGDIDEDDTILLTFGSYEDSQSTRRHYEYLVSAWTQAVQGTKLEGRLTFEFDGSYGDNDMSAFKSGSYDIALLGWTGATWDLGWLLVCYVSQDYSYSSAWDTSAETFEFTMPKEYLTDVYISASGLTAFAEGITYYTLDDSGNYTVVTGEFDSTVTYYIKTVDSQQDYTATYSVLEWYNILTGASTTEGHPNWASGYMSEEGRLLLIAKLEEVILEKYYTVPTYYTYSKSLISYKASYITTKYNTFMGYGGVKYLTYNYDDSSWDAYVDGLGGNLDYTK